MRWLGLLAMAGLGAAGSDAISSGKAADFYVKDLPGMMPGVVLPEMHAGLIEIGTKMGSEEASLFFWHVRATNDTKKTIVWFNGGPGCSSMDGNLLEIGPFRFDESTRLLTKSEDAWSESVNLLFIDQPFGTGYSDPDSGAFATTLDVAADAVVQFFNEYAAIFPEIADTAVYLAGESFAGQYVPYIFKALQTNGTVLEKLGGIAGIMLGNPWMAPAHQYLSYVKFIKDNGLVPQSQYGELDNLQAQCVSDLRKGVSIYSAQCESITQFALEKSKEEKRCFNIYKISESSPYPDCGSEWPWAVPTMTRWLSRHDVRQALHGPSELEKWQECSPAVHTLLQTAGSKPSVAYLPKILQEVPVLLMVGDLDYICNRYGLDHMVENLVWNDVINGQRAGFRVDEVPQSYDFGTVQSARNLTVAHVFNGSHMLPFDNLRTSKQIMMHFTGITPLQPGDGDPGNVPEDSKKPVPSQDEIDDAVLQAYKRAGFVALIVVLVTLLILACVWWRRGEGLSGKGLVQALLQTSTRFKKKHASQYVPLQNLGRRPDVIIEEDEEDVV